MPPRALELVRMGAITHIDKTDHVVVVLVCIAVAIRCPVMPNSSHWWLQWWVRSSHEEPPSSFRRFCPELELGILSWLTFHTTEHPLPFHFVAPIVHSPTELPVYNFDGLVRTADFLRSAKNVVQHGLLIYIGPIWMFPEPHWSSCLIVWAGMQRTMSWGKKPPWNWGYSTKELSVPNWRRRWGYGSRLLPLTSPSIASLRLVSTYQDICETRLQHTTLL